MPPTALASSNLAFATEQTNWVAYAFELATHIHTADDPHLTQSLGTAACDMLFTLGRDLCYVQTGGRWLADQPDRSALLGHTASEIWPQTTAEYTQATHQALSGEATSCPWQITVGTQTEFYQVALSPIHDEMGQITGVLGIGRNTTADYFVEQILQITNDYRSPLQGELFLQYIASQLARILQADYLLIGHYSQNRKQITSNIFLANGQVEQNITYHVAGTPCQHVGAGGYCAYPQTVSALFPQDKVLREWQIESYAGIPLHNGDREVIGLVALFNKRVLRHETAVRHALQIVAMRAAHELERIVAQDALQLQRQFALHLSATSDLDNVMGYLLNLIVESTEMDCGGIYLLHEQTGDLELLAHTGLSNIFAAEVTHLAADSEQARLLKRHEPLYTTYDSLIAIEQQTPVAQEEGLEAVAILPLYYEQRLMGILNLGAHAHISFTAATRQTLEGIAAQLGQAMAHARANDSLRESEVRYRTLIAALAEGVVLQDANGFILASNHSAEQILGLTYDQMIGRHSIDPRWHSIREDGTPFLGTEHPAIITLQTGQPQHEVVMGVQKPTGELTWISINTQPLLRPNSTEPYAVVASFTDITRYINASHALQESEQRYRQMFETNQAVKLIIDPLNGRIVQANQAACDFYGYSHSQITHLNIGDINTTPPEIIRHNLAEAQRQSKLYYNFQHRLATGEVRDVEVYTGPFRNENTTLLFSIIHDITDRKRIEAKLHQLSQAVEQNSAAIAITTLSGTIEYANQRFITLTGRTLAELKSPAANVFESNLISAVLPLGLRQALQNGQEWQGESRNTRPDGQIYWAFVSVTPIKNEAGEATNFLVVKQDITPRKRLEEELHRRNTELEFFNEAGRMMNATLDMGGVLNTLLEKMRRLLNAQACAVWIVDESTGALVCQQAIGYETTNIVGWRLDTGQGLASLVVEQGQSILEIDALNHPRRAPHVDDWQSFQMRSLLAVPLILQGKIIGVFQAADPQTSHFTYEDVHLAEYLAATAASAIQNARLHENLHGQLQMLQQAQQRLIQSEKLAAIGQLVAGVAHELNNPLTGIILYSQLLAQRYTADNALRDDVAKIVTQAQRASGVVRGLLDFARQRPPEHKKTQLNQIIQDTLELLAYEIRTHHTITILELAPELPPILVDPHQIQQVFVNLITNALQAMSQTAGVRKLAISTFFGPALYAPTAEPVIRISVSDTGAGIPAALQAQIFDPFFTTKEVGQGTGLGLSICHGIIQEHKGHIWVESTAGQGTIFYVELPLPTRDANPIAFSTAAPPTADPTAARLLIIDDEKNILQGLSDLLIQQGYRVDIAENGSMGLQLLAQHTYNLILCDWRMPTMSGAEFYQQIQQEYPSYTTKIIVITGDSASHNTHKFLHDNNIPYLNKPFDLATLLRTIQHQLAR